MASRPTSPSQLKTVARPQDVSTALAPLNSKLAAVEQNLAGVVKSEDDRQRQCRAHRAVARTRQPEARARSRRPVRRRTRRGAEGRRRQARPQAARGASKDKGVADRRPRSPPSSARSPTRSSTPTASRPTPSVVDKLLAGAKSVVRVRKSNADAADNSAEAIAARMDAGLKADRLDDVVGRGEEAVAAGPAGRRRPGSPRSRRAPPSIAPSPPSRASSRPRSAASPTP